MACNDASEQAAFVAQRVLELREEGVNLNKMAVLYRSHFHALELQLELTRRNIPFSITSGIRFFEQAHIKDVTAYLKLVLNPKDELSFKRLVQLLPGIGGKGAEKLWKAFRREVEVSRRNRSRESEARKRKQPPHSRASPSLARSTLPALRGGGAEESRGGLGAVGRHHRPTGGQGRPGQRGGRCSSW